MAQSVATVTLIGRCIFGFKWSQVRIHKASLLLFFFSFIPCEFFLAVIPLLLICILENENIGIVSISFIVIHTRVHFKFC